MTELTQLIDWSKMITPEMREAQKQEQLKAQAQREADAVLEAKSRAALVQTASFTAAEFSLLAKAELFPVWTAGETYPQGRRIQHECVVYEVVAADGVTAEAHQPPNGEGYSQSTARSRQTQKQVKHPRARRTTPYHT